MNQWHKQMYPSSVLIHLLSRMPSLPAGHVTSSLFPFSSSSELSHCHPHTCHLTIEAWCWEEELSTCEVCTVVESVLSWVSTCMCCAFTVVAPSLPSMSTGMGTCSSTSEPSSQNCPFHVWWQRKGDVQTSPISVIIIVIAIYWDCKIATFLQKKTTNKIDWWCETKSNWE